MFNRPAVFAAAFATAFATVAAEPDETPRAWNQEILYSILIDRFFDGDPANNVPAESDPALFDKTQQDLNKYHGGDLRGLETAIQRGYFKDLGVTTLAISPPVKNVWFSPGEPGGPRAGYAGDWAQDFADIDPHWTSAKSADGKVAYPDSRDGRMQHYKDFVALAHSNGMRVIQDVVVNHAGPVFYYDSNGNGQLDVESVEEWTAKFNEAGAHENVAWCDLPKWNARKTAPSEPVTILGRELKIGGTLGQLESYGRRGFSDAAFARDEEGKHCDCGSRRDLNTTPGTPHFDQLVDDFVEIYAFYIEEIGVDGLRANLLKQTHRAFWDEFTARLREKLGPERTRELILIGHVNDTSATEIGKYTFRKSLAEDDAATFDTVVNVPFTLSVREYLRPVVGPYGNAGAVEKGWTTMLGRNNDGSKLRSKSGADGLPARRKLVNQIEGADETNRFRVGSISEKQNILANAVALLSEGIPCLYYGTEAGITDAKGKVGKPGETGRLTLVPATLHENFDHIRKTTSFQALSALTALRKKVTSLIDGAYSPLWADSSSGDSDDGVFGFVRYLRSDEGDLPGDCAIVVVNASERSRVTSAGSKRMKLVSRSGKPLVGEGQKLVRLPVAGLDAPNAREQTVDVVWHDQTPQVELVLAPQTVNIYRVAK